MPRENTVVILGVFVADTAYRAERMPRMGETILGQGFALGPGGKGSNQAVAAARSAPRCTSSAGSGTTPSPTWRFETWEAAGVRPDVIREVGATPRRRLLDAATGDRDHLARRSGADPPAASPRAELIADAAVFMTQLEQPLDAAVRGLEIAREGGVTTILNPAPGRDASRRGARRSATG